MRRTAKAWSYHAGEKGRNRVRVFAHPKTATIFLEVKDGGAKRRVALGHRDRDATKAKADQVAAARAQQTYRPRTDFTLATLFDNYVREVTPTKGRHKQAHDRRATRMLLDMLGPQRTAASLTIRDWQRFVTERRRRGDQRAGCTHGQPVGARQIEYDLRLLLAVLNWAVHAGWLDRNPVAGCPFPDGETPHRPILTDEQYRALLAVSSDISPLFRLAVIVTHETGHRIGAVSLLRWCDIDWTAGMVRWRGGQDKIRYEHVTPLTWTARAALDQAQRERGVIGDAWSSRPPPIRSTRSPGISCGIGGSGASNSRSSIRSPVGGGTASGAGLRRS